MSDIFDEVSFSDGDCERCGDPNRVVVLPESIMGEEITLCASELFGDFARVAPEIEDVTNAEKTENKNVKIETSSPLGTFTHLFYADSDFRRVGNGQVIQTLKLTGVSEIFNGDGEFVAEGSPYLNLAKRVAQSR